MPCHALDLKDSTVLSEHPAQQCRPEIPHEIAAACPGYTLSLDSRNFVDFDLISSLMTSARRSHRLPSLRVSCLLPGALLGFFAGAVEAFVSALQRDSSTCRLAAAKRIASRHRAIWDGQTRRGADRVRVINRGRECGV